MAREPGAEKVHREILTDRPAQERAAETAIQRVMAEDGLTRAQAEEVYGVDTEERREL